MMVIEIPWPEGLSLLWSVLLGAFIFGAVFLLLCSISNAVVGKLKPEGLDVPVLGKMAPAKFYFGLVFPISVILGALFGFEMGGQ